MSCNAAIVVLLVFVAFLPYSSTTIIAPHPPSPSPANAPVFSSTGSLARPSDAEPLPSEPVLASDEGSIRSYANASDGANARSDGYGSHSTDTTAGDWDGIRKLFQRALPFMALGMALLCSCGLCCCCYCAWRRANRPAYPPYYGGPPGAYYGGPQGFVFAGGGGPYPQCHPGAPPPCPQGYPQQGLPIPSSSSVCRSAAKAHQSTGGTLPILAPRDDQNYAC